MTARRNEVATTDLPVPPERAFIPPRLQLGLDYVEAHRRAEARKSLLKRSAQKSEHRPPQQEARS